MSKIRNATKIAGSFTVQNWKEQRTELLTIRREDAGAWREAFDIFRHRVETRFLTPIDVILEKDIRKGEGFAIVALQCILVEFFEAFHQGKLYTMPMPREKQAVLADELGIDEAMLRGHLQPNEYSSSWKLFGDFLKTHVPFRDVFTSRKLRSTFYYHIRCGLLHEDATKGSSVIRDVCPDEGREDVFAERKADDGLDLIIYRTTFQKALRDYLETYMQELVESDPLKINYIRKVDDLCQIQRVYYFAHGPDMAQEHIESRIGFTHTQYTGRIRNYELTFDRPGNGAGSRSNITSREAGAAWGVCYEIDAEQLELLAEKHETDCDIVDVAFFYDDRDEGDEKMILAKAFRARERSDAPPDPSHVRMTAVGAREKGLPEEWVRFIEQQEP